jgi:beta-galactosidase
MLLAVAYYPEHWPRERWETDARLMSEAGITRIRIGEFAWHVMEPREDEFSFDLLRDAIDLFARHGIKTILGTPTASYPPWMHRKYADIHQVKGDGRVKEFGQRQDACKNHPGWRLRARKIVEKMAEAFGKHPDVVAWQIDNELGCQGSARCWCANCEQAFQTWLEHRFKDDIGALNRAWGTVFWSHVYNGFNEISPPRDTPDRSGNDGGHPSLVLAFDRFCSAVQVDFLREQAEILRAASPGRIITHNHIGVWGTDIDQYELAREIDIVSWDNYPFDCHGTDKPPSPLGHDHMRGLKQKNVWVMEQASGPGGWSTFFSTPAPGMMRLWAWQAVARGADMVSFFRWRSCRWGR